MIQLSKTLLSKGGTELERALKEELEAIALDALPLQAGLSRSSAVGSSPPCVIVLHHETHAATIEVKLGVSYAGIIAGCACADDPTPVDEIAEYCELQLSIDRGTGAAIAALI